MKDGVAKLVMTRARQLRQVLNEGVAFAPHQPGNRFFAQPRKKLAISGQIAAIEERNRELDVIRVEAFAFSQSPRHRTEFQTQIPQLLRETADGIFEFLLAAASGMQEEEIDVRKGKEPAAPVASGSYQSEVPRTFRIGGDCFIPEANNNDVD